MEPGHTDIGDSDCGFIGSSDAVLNVIVIRIVGLITHKHVDRLVRSVCVRLQYQVISALRPEVVQHVSDLAIDVVAVLQAFPAELSN